MFTANTVNGITINMIKFSYLTGEIQLGTYRQVAPTAWHEVDIQNNVTFYFAETQRTDTSITLYDGSRNVTLFFDFNRSVIVYTDSNNHFDLYHITEATAYVQGWLANQAHFSDFSGNHLGEFRQTGEKLWVEFGKGGVARFHFVETLRDEWSVYLHDQSRNVGLQLDFWRKMVVYSDATPQQFDLYPITFGAALSGTADLTPSLTGKTANRIDFGTAEGQILGYLKKNSLYEWVELGLDQKERFYFTETKSHKGVVVLFDVARSVTLELHLRSKKIIYSDAAANRFELYKIVNAYSKVNGWTANRVDFGSFAGTPLGTYRQTGEKTWAELNSLQKPVFYFNELLRDDWSVYLHDPSRNVHIQLDMYTQKVVYGTQLAAQQRIFKDESTATINGELHLCAVTTDGHLWHTIRRTDGSWYLFGDVEGQTGDVGLLVSVDCAAIAGELHVCAVASDGRLWHTIRRADGGWYPFGDVEGQTGDRGQISKVSCAGSSAGLHVCAVSSDGRLWHTIRRPDGGWYPFGDIEGQTGDRGSFVDMDCAIINEELHVCGTTTDGHLWHTIRRADGSWYGFGDIEGQTGDGGAITSVACAGSNAGLHVCAVSSDGRLWHTIRRPDGGWYGFGDIEGQTGDRGAFVSVDCAVHDEALHVCGTSTDGRLWHSIRYDQGWSPFGDVGAQTGDDPAQGDRIDLYGIVRASAKPSDLVMTSPLPVKGQNVKTVWFAGLNGKPLGAYRQISESKWVETDIQAKQTFSFNEVKRTKYAVYLYDDSRDVSLELNLHSRRIHYSDPSNSFVLYTILRSSALVMGSAVSEVTFATFAGQELGKYRQTGGDEWAEFNQSGTVTAHFKETRREDWLVTLYDASRNVTLSLDLHSQTIYYSDGQTYYAPLYLILREEIEAAVWMQSENITSRSSLTQDFAPDRTARNLNPRPAYRTSISFTRLTSFVDIWASEEVTVEVNGASYTIDPVKSARVQPNALSKLSVSLPATDVQCPTLIVRTNLMMPDEKHYIFPDIEAHKKIVNLKDGDLYKARTQLGISDQYTEEDLAHVQRSLQNIAKTVQHTYNKKPHGVHHDRALLPKNMEHPHFMLDFTGDQPRYKPLHPSEVPALTTGATLLQGAAAQGFFDDVGNFFKKAAAVVVHTVENVGHDIVQTAENIGHDIVQTVDNVGEDIVHGDIAHIGQDLLQGGENIGSDLVKGAGHVVGDVVEGAGQLVVVTLHAAEGLVQFVINHTGFVGKALGWLLEKIGAGLDKVVDWLLDKLGWEDILHTHDVLFQLFNNKVDEFATYPEMIKQRGDQFFTHITDLVSQTMDQAIKQFDVQAVAKQPQPVKGHSGAVEKIEWILGKLVQYAPQAAALAYPSFTPSYHSQADGLVGLLEQQLGGGGQIMKALRQGEEDLVHVFTDPEHSPEYLISLLLELVKAVAVLSLETIKLVFDAILDLIIGLIQAFKTAVNAPWDIPFLGDLYDTLTEGRPLTFLSMICLVIA
ncbi:MAG: hypothetical protein IT327_16210, partial [Anaerolineae bacterium]|nr:hypothetical protein [Anaerolineae bacterium]